MALKAARISDSGAKPLPSHSLNFSVGRATTTLKSRHPPHTTRCTDLTPSILARVPWNRDKAIYEEDDSKRMIRKNDKLWVHYVNQDEYTLPTKYIQKETQVFVDEHVLCWAEAKLFLSLSGDHFSLHSRAMVSNSTPKVEA